MVSLLRLLMTNVLSVVAKVFSNTLIFCCKNVSSNAKATHIFFNEKMSMYLHFAE